MPESRDGNALRRHFWLSLAVGALIGASATALRVALQHDLTYFGVSDLFYLRNFWLAHGLIGGVCIGGLVWTLYSPRQRFVQAVRWLVGLNCAAWTAFVLSASPAPAAEFAEAARARTTKDGGMNWVTDAPTFVAGRHFGGWRSMPLSERFVVTMAGPTVFMAEMLAKPVGFVLARPTRRESYLIATIAFVVSTGFWALVGTTVSRVQRRVRFAKATG